MRWPQQRSEPAQPALSGLGRRCVAGWGRWGRWQSADCRGSVTSLVRLIDNHPTAQRPVIFRVSGRCDLVHGRSSRWACRPSRMPTARSACQLQRRCRQRCICGIGLREGRTGTCAVSGGSGGTGAEGILDQGEVAQGHSAIAVGIGGDGGNRCGAEGGLHRQHIALGDDA